MLAWRYCVIFALLRSTDGATPSVLDPLDSVLEHQHELIP